MQESTTREAPTQATPQLREALRAQRQREADGKNRALRARPASAPEATPNQGDYDVQAYALDLTLDPSSNLLSGSVTVTAEVTGVSIATMDLDLLASMVVHSATSAGTVVATSRSGDVLTVTLDRTYVNGETVVVQVFYGGDPGDWNYFAWDSYNGDPMIWTLSEPFGASHWWPCKNVNDDKADSVSIRATVPGNLIVASNGLLTSDQPLAGTTIDFEDQVLGSGTYFNADPVVSNGFRLTTASGGVEWDSEGAFNGSKAFFSDATPVVLTRVGGGAFTPVSFRAGEDNTPGARILTVIGTHPGGGTVSTTFPIDGTYDGPGGAADYQTFVLPGTFAGIVSLEFDDPNANLNLDDIVIDVGAGDPNRTFLWESGYPIVPYLVSLAIHPYTLLTDSWTPDGGSPMPLQNYLFPDQVGAISPLLTYTGPMLTAFSDAYGEYPFSGEKYGHADFLAGGTSMEHQTLSSMGFWNEDVIAHEMAHQWFGDLITCADFGDIWLNEGFATWSEAYWHEVNDGVATYRAYMDATAYYGPGTIFVEDPPNDDVFDVNLTYNKASWVVHMLRGVLGDTDFFAGIASYRAQYGYASATTEQFRDVMEAVSGKDLDAFFQQWIYGDYFPVYGLGWEQNGGTLDVTITQNQTHGGLFAMPITLRIVTTEGTTDVVVQNSLASESYPLAVSGTVQAVQLDPDHWILRLEQVAIENPTLAEGILLVNGVDWDTYSPAIVDAYNARAFWGDLDITFWDIFAAPGGGYPGTLPAPIGHGSVPGDILGKYSTVIWIGNNYAGDLARWFETPIQQYLDLGGNVLLLARLGSSFTEPDLTPRLGVTWTETSTSIGSYSAAYPGLVNIPIFSQSLNDVFATTVGPNSTLLFSGTGGFPGTRGLGVHSRPPGGGTLRADGAQFVFLSGRPYRMDHTALKTNIQFIVGNMFGEPYTPQSAGCRFASSVIGFSSEYSATDWSAQQALGPPDVYPAHGDYIQAWASAGPDNQPEYLHLGFADPAPINYVNVYETNAPGAISSISVKNPNSGLFETVWTGVAAPAPLVSRIFTATFDQTAFPVSEVRIDFDSQTVPDWNEVDAVAIGYCDLGAERQWASGVVDFSSQYDDPDYAATQVIGPPDMYPLYGDDYRAWASGTPDGQREFLELSYSTPAAINFVSVAETSSPGALDKVLVKNPGTGLFEEVWAGTAAAAPATARILNVSFPETRFLVSEVRLEFDSPAVPDWNEIDAVGIGRCGCQASLVAVPFRPEAPIAAGLEWARPNPFTSTARIGFALSRGGPVKVEIFNVLGQRVARIVDRELPAGRHEIQWDGRDAHGRGVASGVYYVRLEAQDVQAARKLVKIR